MALWPHPLYFQNRRVDNYAKVQDGWFSDKTYLEGVGKPHLTYELCLLPFALSIYLLKALI
jgi:hypothetical protein